MLVRHGGAEPSLSLWEHALACHRRCDEHWYVAKFCRPRRFAFHDSMPLAAAPGALVEVAAREAEGVGVGLVLMLFYMIFVCALLLLNVHAFAVVAVDVVLPLL